MALAEDITEAFGSLPGVRLSLGSSSAIVTLHGAHVVSYIHDERECFASDLAVKDGKRRYVGHPARVSSIWKRKDYVCIARICAPIDMATYRR